MFLSTPVLKLIQRCQPFPAAGLEVSTVTLYLGQSVIRDTLVEAQITSKRGFTRFLICALFNPVMFISPIERTGDIGGGDTALLLEQLALISKRPRYAFMLLNLIAEVASDDGSAGPYIPHGGATILLRDWLCDALTPMGGRDPKRQALASRVRDELEIAGRLPPDCGEAANLVDREVRERVRAAGKTNLSRAVTELVNGGLLKRHYQGYLVDHINRGGQRHVVYSLIGRSRCLLTTSALADQTTASSVGQLRLL